MRCSQPCGVLQRGDNGLDLQVVLQAVNALLPSHTAHLVPAEGDRGVKDVKAVHPDRPNFQCTCQGVRRVYVVGEHTSSQSVLACVGPLDDLIEIAVEKQNES
jgi:hypothetical protein